jgi:hypothetical protein
MSMLFRVCRDEQQERWVVLRDEQFYGEYLDKDGAVLDAIEAAYDARATGNYAEVWDQRRSSGSTDRRSARSDSEDLALGR